ncbi:two-component system phosphate regulon sensor histidine kinase PhoR [Mariniflexile fucanivorans]|uniref:histidine kinase n=1 Tax=Mariniflexile fucanivorans TaxID=264023 RepID=A0A4R1RDP1_9FLAO|nr:HAMP domain-containing sensor histidine kinase [Mariniflexile fucanivorans]TCL63963.1 two-component system phosphate regulon sensor histidine kinase PhoR [Mariniflexile fucanivorans]
MGKKLFVLLILLMSLSLIGIIFVQAYYINNSVRNEKERFRFNVNKVLNYVSNTIEKREYSEYVYKLQDLISQGVKVDTAAIRNLYIIKEDLDSKETTIYRNGTLEENYKFNSSLFDIGLDTISVKRILSNRETKVYQNGGSSLDLDLSTNDKLLLLDKMSSTDEIVFEDVYKDLASRLPIHKRVTKEEIQKLLSEKLKEDGINIDYEFAIYSNGLATRVRSDNFENYDESAFSVFMFYNENNQSTYKLLVSFPDDKKFILSSIMGMILLSVIFTSIIILAYGSALYQLVKQRKISEIKTDFINNMTHEFKTPIATINLALDAIKNPKIIDDKEKVMRYLAMIKEENKRMHAQVENVLRISKLEKNELNISKDRLDLNDLVEDAITHVELIVEDRQGYIKTFFDAPKSTVLANETHFTNVIVNILDNAIKYSPDAPKIEVHTENVGNNILLKIKDHGSGMSKAAAKRVFEKFYREHTGNIHNVKGHGLGLAYVKRIVEDHQGYVSVESEKDKGSTFIIKLPIIS